MIIKVDFQTINILHESVNNELKKQGKSITVKEFCDNIGKYIHKTEGIDLVEPANLKDYYEANDDSE